MTSLMNFAAEGAEKVQGTGPVGAISELTWLVPLLPILSFFVILFFGKRLPNKGHAVGIIAVGAGLLISLVGFFELVAGKGFVEKSWTWFEFASGESLHLEFGMNYDFLTAVMFVVVCTISLLVQIYSTEYMHDDKRYTIYYAMLSLFTGSMLLMLIANNLLQLF
ncbi:MAG: hypothetical protein ACLGIB_12720, partial [Actinomycetota bacterium]